MDFRVHEWDGADTSLKVSISSSFPPRPPVANHSNDKDAPRSVTPGSASSSPTHEPPVHVVSCRVLDRGEAIASPMCAIRARSAGARSSRSTELRASPRTLLFPCSHTRRRSPLGTANPWPVWLNVAPLFRQPAPLASAQAAPAGRTCAQARAGGEQSHCTWRGVAGDSGKIRER